MFLNARPPVSPPSPTNSAPPSHQSRWRFLPSPFQQQQHQRQPSTGNARPLRPVQLFKVLFLLCLGLLTFVANVSRLPSSVSPCSLADGRALRPFQFARLCGKSPIPASRTLIIYVFSNTDNLYLYNLIYFIRKGIARDHEDGSEGEAADYVIVLNGVSDEFVALLPPLPTGRARYVRHKNECYDLGTVGWALRKPGMVKLSVYQWIVWLNSSVRGPFLRPSHPPEVRWHEVLTGRLNKEVKLVGPLVSCEFTPHLQSYVLATDQVGLAVLLKNETLLGCHKTLWDAILDGELGCSRAIRGAGYNLGPLIPKYSGLDWRVESDETRNCWGGLNPMSHSFLEDTEGTVFDLLFVKVKANAWHYIGARAQEMDRRSIEERCFDGAFYAQNLWQSDSKNQGESAVSNGNVRTTMAVETGIQSAWRHFVDQGYDNNLPYRMIC